MSEQKARIDESKERYKMRSVHEAFCVVSILSEYAMSPKVSTKGDVYSYGVVLLEMLTGKQPLNKEFLDEGHVHSGIVGWVAEKTSDDSNFKEILDPTLLENASEISLKQMGMVLIIAKTCTLEIPRNRPKMRDVAEALLKITRKR